MDTPIPPRLEQQVRFLVEADQLKEVFRRTVLTRSRRRENDAEHSWHLCLCALVLAEHANLAGLDLLKVLKMVILHDLVEIDAGDTFAYDTAAMAGQHEREARSAAAVDRFQPMLLNARTEGHAWQAHGVTLPQVLARNQHVAEGSAAL